MSNLNSGGFEFERTICDLHNMARLVALAGEELLLNRHGVVDPDIVRMASADRAMLLYGMGELERMAAELRSKL